MNSKWIAGIVLVVFALIGAGIYWWTQGGPRRQSLASLTRLDSALRAGDRAALLDLLIPPAVVRDRGAAEQAEFLAKALNDEISPEGIATLAKRGSYGPLKELFPAVAESWATQAGVNLDDCVAFKMEREGLCAEVVLVKPSTLNSPPSTGRAPYRIVRVNNVKQMAGFEPVTAEQIP